MFGVVLGLSLGIGEALFRRGWLEISCGHRPGRAVGLGAAPVTIGSDRRTCTVVVKGSAPIALRYRWTETQIYCEEVPSRQTCAVAPSDCKRIGDTMVVVRAATRLPGFQVGPTSLGLTLRLASGRSFHLEAGTKLLARDLPTLDPQIKSGPVAEVNRNPKQPTILGLKNLSRHAWYATTPQGQRRKIDPGRSIQLAPGTTIDFGSESGRVA